MKTFLIILGTVIAITLLNRFLEPKPGVCEACFVVLDEQTHHELKQYDFTIPPAPSVLRRDGAKGFICTFSSQSIVLDISVKGYSHTNLVLTPAYGSRCSWEEPPQQIFLKKLP
jgi:hypothetical protein